MHQILLPSRRLTRLIHAYRHPDQAAIAARLPIIGSRVPARAFWRRRPVRSAARMWRHSRQAAARGISRGATAAAERRAPALRSHWARRLALAGAAAFAGALAMYYADPQQGRRRRALVRDRFAHLRRLARRDVPRTAERRGRFLRGLAKGIGHEAAAFARLEQRQPVDDETLVARVRSEAFRAAEIKSGEIHVDAYQGCVTLRGQLESADDIRRLVEAAQSINGVHDVRNYLHLPATPPPNKGDAYQHVPAHLSERRG